MDDLRIQLLGAPTIKVGHTPQNFVRRRSLAMLAYLAVTQQPVEREYLAALLTDEAPEDNARQHIRNALSDLRTQLGGHIVSNRHTITFIPPPDYRLDVAIFKSLLQPTYPSPLSLRQAIELYQQEFMTGFALDRAPLFDDWLMSERIKLKELLVNAMQQLMQYYNKDHDYSAGITIARQALSVEPWREEIHRYLMELLDHNGERSAALMQYEICRQMLAADFNAEPQPETKAYYHKLLGDSRTTVTPETKADASKNSHPDDIFSVLNNMAEPEIPEALANKISRVKTTFRASVRYICTPNQDFFFVRHANAKAFNIIMATKGSKKARPNKRAAR